VLASRPPHPGLVADPRLPDETRLWAALQDVSGGPWGGSVFDVDTILKVLEAGKKAVGGVLLS
jgi:xylonate dehydratase